LTAAAARKPLVDGPKGFYSYFLLFHKKITNFMWLFSGGKLKRSRKIVPKIAAAQKQESGSDYAPPGVPQGPDCDKRPDGKCA
jgi:hypothetical protein